MSLRVVDCIESKLNILHEGLFAVAITVFAILSAEFSIIITLLISSSLSLFARKITVSKLASDSVEQPKKAA